MAHFANVDANNVVIQVIVAEQDFIDSGAMGDPSMWIQTSYNTIAGEHVAGKAPLRKNFAGVGYTYDPDRDAFVPPKPNSTFILDEDKCIWIPPVAEPLLSDAEKATGKEYVWDEDEFYLSGDGWKLIDTGQV